MLIKYNHCGLTHLSPETEPRYKKTRIFVSQSRQAAIRRPGNRCSSRSANLQFYLELSNFEKNPVIHHQVCTAPHIGRRHIYFTLPAIRHRHHTLHPANRYEPLLGSMLDAHRPVQFHIPRTAVAVAITSIGDKALLRDNLQRRFRHIRFQPHTAALRRAVAVHLPGQSRKSLILAHLRLCSKRPFCRHAHGSPHNGNGIPVADKRLEQPAAYISANTGEDAGTDSLSVALPCHSRPCHRRDMARNL